MSLETAQAEAFWDNLRVGQPVMVKLLQTGIISMTLMDNQGLMAWVAMDSNGHQHIVPSGYSPHFKLLLSLYNFFLFSIKQKLLKEASQKLFHCPVWQRWEWCCVCNWRPEMELLLELFVEKKPLSLHGFCYFSSSDSLGCSSTSSPEENWVYICTWDEEPLKQQWEGLLTTHTAVKAPNGDSWAHIKE